MKIINLRNGNTMPIIGFDTSIITISNVHILNDALELGYRYFEISPIFYNEQIIAQFFMDLFRNGHYKRSEIQISYRLWNTAHYNIYTSVLDILISMNLEYLDFLYIHWPVTFKKEFLAEVCVNEIGEPLIDVFRPYYIFDQMYKLQYLGKIRNLGVCNFGINNLKALIKEKYVPDILQVECHPYLQQDELRLFCEKYGIVMIAYSPLTGLANNLCLKDELICRIADENKITPSQVVLAFTTMRGMAVLPRTIEKKHMEENIDIKELPMKDFKSIRRIKKYCRVLDPEQYGPDRFL